MAHEVRRLPGTDLKRAIGKRRPVIIEGLLVGQQRLTLDDLGERWGDRIVPVAPIIEGAVAYTARAGVPYRRMRLDDYLSSLRGEGAGMVTGRPEEYLPGIGPHLPSLEPGEERSWRRDRIWISPAKAVTPLHHEVTHNLLTQLEGDKVVTLYSPWSRRAMYPNRPWSRMPHTSRVAAHAPDLIAQPRFAAADPQVATLSPGDVLFIPALWWHWVRAMSTSLSYNLWFAGGPIAIIARAMERYKRFRSLAL